ncbi:MAG: NAD(P)/FAD-dependent oxidoreductase [Acidobacteriaceae bacterium]
MPTKSTRPAPTSRPPDGRQTYDVVIAGGGPAGSTLAWKLASQGMKVLVLERAKFPREKVCGDYVEPRGLRILSQMGGLAALEATLPLPITHSSTWVDDRCEYSDRIPFYGVQDTLPPHGYIVPRHVLDTLLLAIAAQQGAEVRYETYVTGFTWNGPSGRDGVTVQAQCKGASDTWHARAIVGADGVNSVVARTAGLLVNDPRHIALSQRAYVTGFSGRLGEAAFFFDAEFFPGYGWMFPMSGGMANVGVGILKETCQREGIAVPELFQQFLEKLKVAHSACRRLKLAKPAIGGIVKTYGCAGPNYFDRGLLIGDAGCFVDPMTGEGITPAMESALLAARVLTGALQDGNLDAEALSIYEQEHRNYFGPAMVFTDLCATTLRNPHYWPSWKRAIVRGCRLAQRDKSFAATAGGCFGGIEVQPAGILAEVWKKTAEQLIALGPQSAVELMQGKFTTASSALREGAGWLADSWKSIWDDPAWHAKWALDVQGKWVHALDFMVQGRADPRTKGLSS